MGAGITTHASQNNHIVGQLPYNLIEWTANRGITSLPGKGDVGKETSRSGKPAISAYHVTRKFNDIAGGEKNSTASCFRV